jgi:uncharacterized protein
MLRNEGMQVTPSHPDAPISLRGTDHCFLKGHKIMVQVQSTWFPVIDRNPQKFVNNIFFAEYADFQKATQRVYRCPASASHLVLPVVKRMTKSE